MVKKIYLELPRWLANHPLLVLATIISTEGSTPQIPGAAILVGSSGLLAGTLGGGWLEKEAIAKAKEVLASQRPSLIEFKLTASSLEEGLPVCGGKAQVLIEPLSQHQGKIFNHLIQSIQNSIPGLLVTKISQDKGKILNIERTWVEIKNSGDLKFSPSSAWPEEAMQECFHRRQPKLIYFDDQAQSESLPPTKTLMFIEPIFPPERLIIVGAGHVGQAVAHLGAFLNFEVVVIDERKEWAIPDRFPEAKEIIVGDIEEVLQQLDFDPDTYVVIVTPEHRKDAEALRTCLGKEVAYLGMIGSRRKVEVMRQKFLKEKWATPEQWAQIHSPIGLEIGSKTVPEIAISIAAELVKTRSKRWKMNVKSQKEKN